MRFEWDEAKAETNVYKHGVTFTEATSVFDDPYARVIGDPTTRGRRSASSSSA